MYTNIVILLCKVYIVQALLINLAQYTQPLRKVCQVRCKHSGSYILHLCIHSPLEKGRHLASKSGASKPDAKKSPPPKCINVDLLLQQQQQSEKCIGKIGKAEHCSSSGTSTHLISFRVEQCEPEISIQKRLKEVKRACSGFYF